MVRRWCWVCDDELPEDGKIRKKERPSKCVACKREQERNRRNADPLRLIQHRWKNAIRKRHPFLVNSVELTSIETVHRIYNKWNQKSVISGESDAKNLCISPFNGQTPNMTNLLLVTSKEAQMLAGIRDARLRLLKYPVEVARQYQNANATAPSGAVAFADIFLAKNNSSG